MTMRLFRFRFVIACFLALVWSTAAHADLTLSASAVSDGFAPAPLALFEDQTDARSVIQAQAQFARLKQAGQISETPVITFNRNGAVYWLAVTMRNTARAEKWWLTLKTQRSGAVSPIRSLTVYDAANAGGTVAHWPDDQNASPVPSVALVLKAGETATRYILVETWPGVASPIEPMIETKNHMDDDAIDLARKIGLLWLIVGAAFGASLVQLVLTHQSVQGFLAINAVLVGAGTFIMQRGDLVPGLINYHPFLPPMAFACICGIMASIILWATTGRYGVRSAMCILPIGLNAAAFVLTIIDPKIFNMLPFALERMPLFMMTLTGLSLIAFTIILGLADANIFWLLPAWLMLTVLPWLSQHYPFIANSLYLVLLGIVGVASVFWFWKKMDRETETLQNRLRQDMANGKLRHKKETDDWIKKMETQRALLNELRAHDQQRSAELEVATREAEAANKAKSDFLAIISHEIRTPMNGIMGIVQLINQTPLDEKQSEYIDVIKNSGDTMLTLLNDILDYSKIEKGVIDLESILFSLPKLVKSVATLMSGRAADKNLDIIIDIRPDLTETRVGDPNRIRQILLNLVGNAIKFTERGSVTIRIGRRTTEEHNPPHLYFEIIDTGMGISAEAQQKLFQAYAQADASISRRFGGTGLGLNICRMLTFAMGGTIGVASEENRGSTFWFELPLPAAEAINHDARPEMIVHRPNTGKALSIMVIDDNAVNLKIVSGLLEMDGHRVTIVDSAKRALAMIDEQPVFDVIFVDIMMPEMDGRTFLSTLQNNPDTARAATPVFALTGVADQDSVNALIALGMVGVITKPVIHATLRDAIKHLYDDAPTIQTIMENITHMSEAEKNTLRHALGVPSNAVPSNNNFKDFLNMSMLGELKSSLPAETLDEIFTELIDKAKELTKAIEHANNNNDFKTLGAKAHDLRGMSGNFGMQQLMEHSANIENAIREGLNAKAASLAQESRSMLNNSLAALDAWLKS